jgi:hypothetical protein
MRAPEQAAWLIVEDKLKLKHLTVSPTLRLGEKGAV